MRVTATTSKTVRSSTRKCPNKPKIAKRYGHMVAQAPNAVGDLVCMACGHDHTQATTPSQIALKIKAAWLAQGVNIPH